MRTKQIILRVKQNGIQFFLVYTGAEELLEYTAHLNCSFAVVRMLSLTMMGQKVAP
jgi:hypothetical protein